MPPRNRDENAAPGEPMAVDGGRAGLEQSIHHQNHGTSAFNGRSSPETVTKPTDIRSKAFEKISSLVPGPLGATVWHVVEQLLEAELEEERRKLTAPAPDTAKLPNGIESIIEKTLTSIQCFA